MSFSEKIAAGILGKTVTGIATLGPLGTRMPAPGTWGSAAGMLFYAVFFSRINNASHWFYYAGAILVLAVIAVGVCEIAELHLKKSDPGCVILDEFIAMPVVYAGVETYIARAAGNASQYGWIWFFAGFAAFRFFDIVKPFGIKKLQKLPGGLGVVVDDLAAAACACAFLHAAHFTAKFFV